MIFMQHCFSGKDGNKERLIHSGITEKTAVHLQYVTP